MLQQILTTVGTAVVLAWVARLAMRAPQLVGNHALLRYPRFMRGFLWFGLLFFLAVGVDTAWPLLTGSASTKDLRTAAIGLPMMLLMTALSLGELRVALLVDRDGVRGRTAWRGKRGIAWSDVTCVKWSAWNRWFVLIDRRGEKLRVSTFLQGHEAVVMALRAHVPAGVWGKAIVAWERTTGQL